MLGDCSRSGTWQVCEHQTAFAVLGDVTIDLREAAFPHGEVVITGVAILGDVKVYVNAATRLIVDGVAVLGDFKEGRARVEAELDADSPVVRVNGTAVLGNVRVERRAMPGEEPRRRLGWRR